MTLAGGTVVAGGAAEPCEFLKMMNGMNTISQDAACRLTRRAAPVGQEGVGGDGPRRVPLSYESVLARGGSVRPGWRPHALSRR